MAMELRGRKSTDGLARSRPINPTQEKGFVYHFVITVNDFSKFDGAIQKNNVHKLLSKIKNI